MKGTYLYAIMAGRRRLSLGHLGLPEGSVAVTTLPGHSLSAVVSGYRGERFGDLPRPALLRCLTIHQGVIERAMALQPVLPAKFGTVLASHGEVREALDCWQDQLTAAISQFGDAVEVEIAATWDLRRTFAEIAALPEIAALSARAAGRPAEETLMLRVQAGKRVKELLDSRRDAYREQIMGELAPLTRDAQPNPVPVDELVCNLAFLVDRARLDGFYARVHRLDEAFASRVHFRCVGPLPPYSFGTVEIARPAAGRIEAARRLLELGERVSESELNAAYRRLAAGCHPDRHPEDPEAAGRFAALSAGHAELLAYLRGRQARGGAGHSLSGGSGGRGNGSAGDSWYDLTQTAVEATLLLTIKRSGSPQMQAVPSHDHDAISV